MDSSFMESIWWVLKQLFDKGVVYRGYKVMPYSTALNTPLSNFEAQQNYKDVQDPAIVVCFPLLDDPQTNLLVWTTTHGRCRPILVSQLILISSILRYMMKGRGKLVSFLNPCS